MELPGFFNKVVVDAELDVVVEYGPFDGFRIMASRGDYVLVHAWSNVSADTINVYESVSEALVDNVPDDSVEEFLASNGGTRCDGCGVAVGTALRPEDVRLIREWIADEA